MSLYNSAAFLRKLSGKKGDNFINFSEFSRVFLLNLVAISQTMKILIIFYHSNPIISNKTPQWKNRALISINPWSACIEGAL